MGKFMATIFTCPFVLNFALFLQFISPRIFLISKIFQNLPARDASVVASNTLSGMHVEGTYLDILLINEHAELRISGPKLPHDRCHT